MPAKNGRNVSLTDEQDAFVDRLVKSGRYASASEVVRQGLRLLQREEEARLLDKWLLEGLTPEEEAGISPEILDRARESLRAKVRIGLDAARRGELIDGEEFFRELLEKHLVPDPSVAGNKSGKEQVREGFSHQ